MQVCVRVVNSSGIISEAIDIDTWSPCDHVELITMDGLGAFGARSSGGVQVRHLDYEKFSFEERFWVEVDDEAGAAAWAWAMQQIGKPYDYLDIVGILVHRDWREEGRWICSELVARFFEISKNPIIRPCEKINRITPGMIYVSTELIDFGWRKSA